jgi:ribokinase
MTISADRIIAVFGSINADMIFESEHLPVPGQTLLARNFRIEAGGKGANQAVAAARDGASVTMVGAVGTDALAEPALSGLRESGADLSHVALSAQPTGCAGISTDSEGRNQIVVSLGANASLSGKQLNDALLLRSSLVLLQMETPVAAVEDVIARAHAAGVRSILNLAPAIPISGAALRACGMIIVNEDEANALGGWLGCGPGAAELHNALGVDIVRTLGGEGAEAFSGDRGLQRVSARSIKPVDTTATGDCFIGVLAAELTRGSPLIDAMIWAGSAAALCCLRRGSQSSLPRHDETREACARWARASA